MARMKTILLGKIIKINGFEGAVTVRTEKRLNRTIPLPGPVFLEIDGRPVPFFIEYSEQTGADLLVVKFEDYDSYGKVSEFLGCRILVEESEPAETEAENEDLSGYTVLSDSGNMVGCVSAVAESPGQLLLKVIDNTGNELLIPLHEDLIISVDQAKKEIVMIIPEGLTGLNK